MTTKLWLAIASGLLITFATSEPHWPHADASAFGLAVICALFAINR